MEIFTFWVNLLATIYIAIPIIVGIVILILWLTGKCPEKETFDKLLEFGKWYMVAVAIVFATKILDSSFTDRETSIKEIAIYDKYATNILQANNIEMRWKLSEYFAAVTPSETLRERWEEYKNVLEPQYEDWLAINKKLDAIKGSVKDTTQLTPEQQLAVRRLYMEKAAYDKPLVATAVSEQRYVIVFTSDDNLTQAQYENTNLKKAGIPDAAIIESGKWFLNISKAYPTKEEAAKALSPVKNKVRSDAYITSRKF